jgi:hypothetical protein
MITPRLRRIVLFDIVLPLVAVFALERGGATPFVAYGTAALFPAFSVAVGWFRRRSLDLVGAGVLMGIASTLVVALLTHDPRFELVRAAPAFAVFGLACLASLASSRPLMFFVARGLATKGDEARVASWNQRLKSSSAFRQTMRYLTAGWGLGTLAQAALGFTVAFVAPAGIALAIEPLMAIAIIGALLAWSRTLSRTDPNRTANQEM